MLPEFYFDAWLPEELLDLGLGRVGFAPYLKSSLYHCTLPSLL